MLIIIVITFIVNCSCQWSTQIRVWLIVFAHFTWQPDQFTCKTSFCSRMHHCFDRPDAIKNFAIQIYLIFHFHYSSLKVNLFHGKCQKVVHVLLIFCKFYGKRRRHFLLYCSFGKVFFFFFFYFPVPYPRHEKFPISFTSNLFGIRAPTFRVRTQKADFLDPPYPLCTQNFLKNVDNVWSVPFRELYGRPLRF